MAHSAGNKNVELVVVGDDVSVPHSRGKMVGRRCLAGITLGEFSSAQVHPSSKRLYGGHGLMADTTIRDGDYMAG